MSADADLSGVVGNDDRGADQAMMAGRTPDARFTSRQFWMAAANIDID